MATYTGITSIDTLFDANLAEPPGRSTLHSASMRNDAASARLVMRNMDAFLEHVLDVAPKHMKGKPFDGLFGDVKAYFGMVETQGGGTLHAHFLVWLVDAPPNSVAFDRAVAAHGDAYFRDIEDFTDSIVSTSMPLRVADVSCRFCGHSYSDLQELPIPPEAYEEPSKQCGFLRGEPLLVRCSGCSKAMSSQHVLRRVLLANRPSSWPPPMREPTKDELETAVLLETPCRGSTVAAKAAVSRRDMMLSAAEPDEDISGDYLRALNGTPSRSKLRQDDAFRDDVVARALVMQPPSVDDQRWSPRVVAFAVSMLVFLLNLHWWSHVGSCFKKRRGSMGDRCRYGFPRVRVAQTSYSKNDSDQLERKAPFEFVNGFNSVMMLAFKSNHDIQVLIGGLQALVRIFYATKYVTKMQEQIDSITAVALSAFRRHQLRELQNSELVVARSAIGRRRVASLLFAITNRREIAGPLAALYVLRGSCAYMSTPCATLPLRNVVDELIEQAAHSCGLVELQKNGSNIGFRAASFLDDYLFRPLPLDRLCLYEFVMKHFRGKQRQSTPVAALFLPDHPLFNTHCIGTHTTEVVPIVTRMPYLDSESPRDLIVKRSQYALVLFKPFRAVTDLATEPTSSDGWIDAHARWEPTRTNFICEIMANMDYYIAAKQAKEYGDASAAGVGDAEPDLDTNTEGVTGSRCDIDAALDSIETEGGDEAALDDESSRLPIFPNCSTGLSCVYHELLGRAAQNTVGTFEDVRDRCRVLLFSTDELQEFVNDISNDEAEPLRLRQAYNERPTEVVELIANALKSDYEWSPPTQPQTKRPQMQPYASIDQVSKAFTLNQRQHVAFTTITTSLLRRILHQELGSLDDKTGGYCLDNFEARFRDDQLLMFLGDAGGTGKSRVIDAVYAFFSSWHRDDSIVKTALTGKAATLIGGRTLASFLLGLKHAIKEKKFAPLDLLVIDEVSMMRKPEWLKLDKLLRRYKQVFGVPFGGVHIVLVGDFLEMPPVNADPIYIDPVEKAKPSTSDIEGFDLWREFTTVVILEESVRFRSDPAWGDGCRCARLGQWTSEFIDLINSRVVQQQCQGGSGLGLQNEIGDTAVFVTPETVTRLAINNALVAETARMQPNNAFPIRVVANFKGALNGLSQSDLRYVMSLPDNRFGRMAPYLDLIDGMPIQVTQNVATAKGIANGTLGSLEFVHFPVGTQFRLVRDGGSNTVVQLPNQPPDYAVIRVPRTRAAAIRPGLDPELFPVFYATEAYMKTTISLPRTPDGQPRSITIKPKQFPFVCAVGSTVYKVQGETLQSMVVMDWKATQRIVNKPQQTYLLVSRVTSRNALVALTPFTAKLAAWSKPSPSALKEEIRLNLLSDIILAASSIPATKTAGEVNA